MSFPWTEYPEPKGSFGEPIEPILTEPDDPATRRVVSFSADYVTVILGALTQLMMQSTWNTDYDGYYAMCQRITALMELINNPMPVIEGVRQDAVNPCLLEFTVDGVTWTQFADINGCPPIIERDSSGQLRVGYHTTGGFGYYHVPDGAFVADPITAIAGATPTGSLATNTNDRCLAAANAANTIRQLYKGIGDQLTAVAAPQLFTNVNSPSWIASTVAQLIDALIGVALENASWVAFAVVVIGLQTAYKITNWSDADLADLECLFYNRITGSAGNWALDYTGFKADVDAKAVARPVPWDLIRVIFQYGIGAGGAALALKTTQITSGGCDCDTATCWKVVYDYSLAPGVPPAGNVFFAGNQGRWINGKGWLAASGDTAIRITVFCPAGTPTPVTKTRVTIFGYNTGGGNGLKIDYRNAAGTLLGSSGSLSYPAPIALRVGVFGAAPAGTAYMQMFMGVPAGQSDNFYYAKVEVNYP